MNVQPAARGVVKWFNIARGFGFITIDNGHDIFVHSSAIPQNRRVDDLPALFPGERVEFTIGPGSVDRLQANDIRLLQSGG
ncbi:cold-shock protein [Nocardia arizonensis]|uniref:cold-shock protein n=1 Tax=Nocardia arizonensis TaxID=1141647 RepID=UPI000B2CE55C|nr:cold shock domain-containing protein [Nocardia arizonensis]